MHTNKVYRSIIKATNTYQAQLLKMNEEDFQLSPPMGGWSYSEVYSHIFDSSLLSVMALNNCLKGEGEYKATLFGVKLVLFFGSFPPGQKYKVPQRLAERVKKIGTTAAQQLLTDFELQLGKTYPQLNQANPKVKVKHPRLGYLNAKQWFRFIEIHLKHHLKQLKRIENSFELAR